MTDADIIRAWCGMCSIRVIRDHALNLIADHPMGERGLVRTAVALALDAPDDEIRTALKQLADDAVVAIAAYPLNFTRLDKKPERKP